MSFMIPATGGWQDRLKKKQAIINKPMFIMPAVLLLYHEVGTLGWLYNLYGSPKDCKIWIAVCTPEINAIL